MTVWTSKLDDKYDISVESKGNGYIGDLVIKDGDKELLREETTISYGARFGPDIADVDRWGRRCIEIVDALEKEQ